METAIIVVTYNGMPWINNCLESCKGYKSIVVDNASNDGTPFYIKDNFPETILIEQKENLGFGQANNLGISKALQMGIENVFLLNQDAYLVGDCIAILNKTYNEHPEYGVLSPIHLDGSGNFLDKRFAKLINFEYNPHFLSDIILNNTLRPVYDFPFINAAGWLVPKKTLDQVGGFDPLFFHYGEDDNYCQRTMFHGFKIGVVPNVFLKHDREERLEVLHEEHSQKLLDKIERKMKVKFGNLLFDNLTDLKKLSRKRNLEYVKLLLKGNFSQARFKRKEAKMINNLIPRLEASRTKNLRKAPNYLN